MSDENKVFMPGIALDSFHDIRSLQAAAGQPMNQLKAAPVTPSNAQLPAQPPQPSLVSFFSILAKKK